MKDLVKAIDAGAFDSATLTGGYDPVFVGGLPEACEIIRIVNTSNVAVGLSFDGAVTHEFIPAGTSVQHQFQTNSRPNNKVALMAKGTNVCLIGQAGVGTIYIIGYYQD